MNAEEQLVATQLNSFLQSFARSRTMKVRDVIRLLHEDGWYPLNQEGSHRHFRHPDKPGKVTVAGKPGQEVAVGTWKSILRQAGISESQQ